MRVLRRRRIYSILGFLGIVAFIFMCFQLFTLEVLNSESAREARNARLEHNHPHKELLLPPTVKVDTRDNKRLLPPPTQQKVQGLRPDVNEHVLDAECLPGSDCAKKQKRNDSHVGELRFNKYGVERPVTRRTETENDVGVDTLQHSNKRLMDRVEKFGQYVNQKIKENEKFEKIFKDKLEKLRSKNGTQDIANGNAGANSGKALRKPGAVMGILEKDQHLYDPDKGNQFTCLNSKEKISWEQVNDDYCDCVDGTDEPGTSACPDTKFYCTFQLEGSKALWVWSNQVNDGLCDCCDASDEYQRLKLPEHVKRKGEGPHGGVFHEPCKNRCSDLVVSKVKILQVREEGLRLRQKYVQEVQKSYRSVDPNLYGDDGAWAYLEMQCFETKVGQYVYKVCPFRSISQQDPPSTAMNIGRNPIWQTFDYSNGYRLLMDEGDSTICPDRRARKTMLEFSCALENKILGVHETESCSYSIQFSTPLACL